MVRLFIRNGTCGVEKFFKLFSTESKVSVFLLCYQKESVTFRDLNRKLHEEMEKPTLAKRLTEYVNHEILDKIVYPNDDGNRTVYRITQKAIDITPAFDMMKKFYLQWFHPNDDTICDWITYTRKLLGSRWNARIIWLLFVLRSVRFNELKDSIEGISFKVLTQQLRYLENENVLLRKDFQENPPHIEYSLTKKGEDLYQILLLVSSWNAKYDKNRIPPNKDYCSLNLSI